jgi:hypothetical protein
MADTVEGGEATVMTASDNTGAAGRKSSEEEHDGDIVRECSLEDVEKSSAKSGMLFPLCSEGSIVELQELLRVAELNENLFKLILGLLCLFRGVDRSLATWRSTRSS